MATLTAPPPVTTHPVPEADNQPTAPGLPGPAAPQARPAATPRDAADKEPPLTGREVVEYVAMFVLGVLITIVTLWFYGLVQ